MEINPFSATLPNLEKITHPDDFFQSVKAQYSPLSNAGFFSPATSPAIYIQQISSPKHDYLGIIAGVPVQAYRDGLIRGHEETLEHRVRIQVALLQERQAMVKPVLLTYNRVEAIQEWMQKQISNAAPLQQVFFEQDQAYYKLWEVQSQEAIHILQEIFRSAVAHCYIADGHHRMRCAAADDLQLSAVLCALYPQDQVLIRDFNRQVFYPDNFDSTQFLVELGRLAKLQVLDQGRKPRCKHELSLYLDQQWYRLEWKEAIIQNQHLALPLLDTSLLNEQVLGPLLGVNDLRKTDQVKYIDGQVEVPELETALQQEPDSLLFCLYPVDWLEMVQWADQGQTLPPKSTWFEPRMKNGLVVKEL